MGEKIGNITHYLGNIQVAVLELSAKLKVGDTIQFLGHTTDFSQEITSMQIDYKDVESADPGADVALKVTERVRVGDEIIKVED